MMMVVMVAGYVIFNVTFYGQFRLSFEILFSA